MATVSKEEIMMLASLSRLHVYEDELDELTAHVEAVLTYAQRVTQVAREVAEPQALPSNVFRADTVTSADVAPLLAQAPEREGNYFVVPRIIESTEKKQ